MYTILCYKIMFNIIYPIKDDVLLPVIVLLLLLLLIILIIVIMMINNITALICIHVELYECMLYC